MTNEVIKRLKITDDSGFLAVVNSETYISNIGEDWEFNMFKQHLIKEINNKNIIFWSTGLEYFWTVSFVFQASCKKSFREFTSTIKVTNEKLYLSNYEDLTMSAQFEEIKIPLEHNSDLFINLENGYYNLTVRQLFNPYNFNYDADESAQFEIVIQNTSNNKQLFDKIFWLDEQSNC